MNGVVYVTYGLKTKKEVVESIRSLKQHNNLPITVIDEFLFPNEFQTDGQRARWAKLNIPELVDYDNILYLDADTRVKSNLSIGFQLLDDGWDMALAPSKNQDGDLFVHISDIQEKMVTLEEIENSWPLQLQCGVMWFSRERCTNFFKCWREEYRRYGDQDQAAFLRALQREPIRVWLLGRPFNGGELVEHRFGACR